MSTTAAKTVTIRRHSWNPAVTVEVTLEPLPTYDGSPADDWYVTYKGVRIGRIDRYDGTLDRPAGTLRIEGKRRVLWASQIGTARPMWDRVSRADAIRDLLDSYDRRTP